MEFGFHFDSSHADLLDANRVLNRVGCFRGFLHLVGAALGFLWLVAALLDWTHTTSLLARAVLSLAGAALIWRFVLHPYLVRRNILTVNEPIVTVQVGFNESRITAGREEGSFTVGWSEVLRVVPSPNGVLVVLRGGRAHWLPERVFKGADEKSRFLSFVAHHLRKRTGKQH